MMLQINLLPGSKKTTRGAGSLAGSLGSIGASVRDPWLVGAAGAVVTGTTPANAPGCGLFVFTSVIAGLPYFARQ